MQNLKSVETERIDKLITVWLNLPEKLNALNHSIIEELIRVFKWINEQEDITVILLRGRGKSFCAGADIKWMTNSGLLGYDDSYRDSEILAKCFHTIYMSDKVVINLVHGDVFGGALGFLGAGDFTFAEKGTRFCLPELRLGLIPSVIMPYLLLKIKSADLRYHIFSNWIFTAEEAKSKGYIDAICENKTDMELKSNELVNRICSSSPIALTEAKRLLRFLNNNLINPENIKKTVETITRLKLSADSRARMSGFFTGK